MIKIKEIYFEKPDSNHPTYVLEDGSIKRPVFYNDRLMWWTDEVRAEQQAIIDEKREKNKCFLDKIFGL